MYLKDKNVRITLRLNQQQFDFVKQNADELGVSPSDFLRMVINTTRARKFEEDMEKSVKRLQEFLNQNSNTAD